MRLNLNVHLLHSATKPVALTTLSHTSADIVQCVVFTPLFATLPPSLYIVYCNTMNFTLSIVHLFAIILAPLRGWGFAFWGGGRTYKIETAYTKIQTLQKSMVNLIYKFNIIQIPFQSIQTHRSKSTQ